MASPTPTATQTPDRPRSLPWLTVQQVIGRLQSGYQQDAPWAVASVARLRREAGREAHVSPTAWGLEHLERLAELRAERREAEQEARGAGTADPADLSSRGYAAREARERREDTAVHLAVTLWALHQQSLRDDAMHRPGWTLGRAVRRLAQGRTGTRDVPVPKDAGAAPADDQLPGPDENRQAQVGAVDDASETVRRRFVRVGGASDTEVLATRLRELVLLLRTARIPLDYALLADQLLRWQDENQRDTVRRTWGRDFHRRYRSTAGPTVGDGTVERTTDAPDDAVDPTALDGDV